VELFLYSPCVPACRGERKLYLLLYDIHKYIAWNVLWCFDVKAVL